MELRLSDIDPAGGHVLYTLFHVCIVSQIKKLNSFRQLLAFTDVQMLNFLCMIFSTMSKNSSKKVLFANQYLQLSRV